MKVLVVIVDDLGRDLMAQAPLVRLPELAKLGKAFTNPWMGPLCSNFRACFNSGRESHDLWNLVGGNFPAGDPNFYLPYENGGLLGQQAPGATAYIGKWHLSHANNYAHPNFCGWDYFSGSMTNLGDFYSWVKVTNGSASQESVYAPFHTHDEALAQIKAGIDLVVASFHLPHNPYHEPPAGYHTQRPPWDNYKYAIAMTECLDVLAGNLIEQAFVNGYGIFFLSDNGTAPALGGKKGTLYEQGINCPLFVLGRGILPGTVSDLVQATDFHATILDLMDGGVSPEASNTFAPALFDAPYVRRNWNHCSKWFATGQVPEYATWDRAARSKNWKLMSVQQSGATVEKLFDLQNDRAEQNDLIPGGLSGAALIAYNRLKFELPTI